MTVTLHVAAAVLDIEGTATPLAFVHDVLFPYAGDHLAAVLARRHAEPAIAAIADALAAEHAADATPERPPRFELEGYVRWLMARNSKSTALKALQGVIWRGGYEAGALRSPVYDDVPPALAAWRAAGLAVAIYSSGSIEAQQLLFRHATQGDLTPLLDRYFDTTTGGKREAASYARIAAALGCPPDRVAFLSDVGEELVACRAAGMHGVRVDRPGNAPVDAAVAAGFPVITRFDQLQLAPAP